MDLNKLYLKINDRFPEPLFDELDLKIFVDTEHGHDNVTGRSITGIISVVDQRKQPFHRRDRH